MEKSRRATLRPCTDNIALSDSILVRSSWRGLHQRETRGYVLSKGAGGEASENISLPTDARSFLKHRSHETPITRDVFFRNTKCRGRLSFERLAKHVCREQRVPLKSRMGKSSGITPSGRANTSNDTCIVDAREEVPRD